MAGKSLPPVSAKVIADAEQFIAEFRRAEQQARGTTGRVGAEVDKMARSLSKKFQLGDIGKDVLRGLGIGGGFALAQQAAGMLVGEFEKAAEAAKSVEESIARQVGYTQELLRLRQTDQQALDVMIKDQARMERERAAVLAPKFESRWVSTGFDRTGKTGKMVQVQRELNAEEQAEAARLAAELSRIGLEIEKARAKISGDEAAKAQQTARTSLEGFRLKDEYEGIAEAEARGAAALAEWNAEMEKAADSYREVADPSLKFKNRMAEANDLLHFGKLSAKEAAAAIAKLTKEMNDAEASRVDGALKDFFGPLDEQQKALEQKSKKAMEGARELGWAFSSAFEDAILEGKKLSEVLDGLGRDIMRIILRQAVTQPLANAVMGGLGSIFGSFGGGKAVGGPVSSGTTYLVGEEGPELFTPSTSGAIVPNHRLASAGSGGGTYYIDARGADRTGLARLESMIRQLDGSIEHRALGAVIDRSRRGALA